MMKVVESWLKVSESWLVSHADTQGSIAYVLLTLLLCVLVSNCMSHLRQLKKPTTMLSNTVDATRVLKRPHRGRLTHKALFLCGETCSTRL
jgi:hypothetical protein